MAENTRKGKKKKELYEIQYCFRQHDETAVETFLIYISNRKSRWYENKYQFVFENFCFIHRFGNEGAYESESGMCDRNYY